MFIESINKYVIDFITNNQHNSMIEQWNSKKNQQNLIKLFKKNNVKVKDPFKPKRGKSGFLFFCDENRDKLKKEFPEMSVKQIVSTLGLRWKTLKINNSSEIQKYEQMSVLDRNRYKKEMSSYVPLLNRKYEKKSIDRKKKNIDKISSEKNTKKRSKRTQTEIMFDNYIKNKRVKIRKSHPELDSKGVLDYLKDKWDRLPIEKREKYLKKKIHKTSFL